MPNTGTADVQVGRELQVARRSPPTDASKVYRSRETYYSMAKPQEMREWDLDSLIVIRAIGPRLWRFYRNWSWCRQFAENASKCTDLNAKLWKFSGSNAYFGWGYSTFLRAYPETTLHSKTPCLRFC